MELESFQLVLLHTTDEPPDHDEATLARIQAEHLAFYQGLRERGDVVTNGPVMEQTDARFRGLAFYRLSSVEEARRVAATDPAVVAERLAVTAMTWWCPAGTMVRRGAPVALDDQGGVTGDGAVPVGGRTTRVT